MTIFECSNKKVKFSQDRIIIRENGETSGVVENITFLADMQHEKKSIFIDQLVKLGIDIGRCGQSNVIVKNGVPYVFRNIGSKLINQKLGYLSEQDKKDEQEADRLYATIKNKGINVIECVYI